MDRPLLMSAELVPPTLREEKTETRRLRDLDQINEHPSRYRFTGFDSEGEDPSVAIFEDAIYPPKTVRVKCPYGVAGDRLWGRENWYVDKTFDNVKPVDLPDYAIFGYMADGTMPEWAGKLRPSIHMPRMMSRITLEIISIKVERLQDITEAGAMAEGMPFVDGRSYRHAFRIIWIRLNGLKSWNTNPWVWVIKFKIIKNDINEKNPQP